MVSIDGIIQQTVELIADHIVLGVFAAALIETVLPVIPSFVIFPLAGYLAAQSGMGAVEAVLLGAVGGAGATIGSVVPFLAAWKLGRLALRRYLRFARISEKKLDRAEEWFARHGYKAVFLGRLAPAVREIISIPAGLLRMEPLRFLLYTFAGSCAWCTALILAGYYLGPEALEHLLGA